MKRNEQRQERRLDEAGGDSNLATDHHALAEVSSCADRFSANSSEFSAIPTRLFHQSNRRPLIPSFSLREGEVARRAVEGDDGQFRIAIRRLGFVKPFPLEQRFRRTFRALKPGTKGTGNPARKAAVNAPHSRRFAKFEDPDQSRQRLECGGFSTALGHWLVESGERVRLLASSPARIMEGVCGCPETHTLQMD